MNNYCVPDCNDCPYQTEYLEPMYPQLAKNKIECKCAMQTEAQMLISNCCGAPCVGDGCEEMGLCPDCKEHCEWEEQDE